MNISVVEQITDHENTLLEAMRSNNVVILEQLIHEQLLFNTPDGQTATKAIDIDNYRSGKVKWHTIQPSDRTINIIEDNAVVVVTMEIQGNYCGQEIQGKFRYLRVWKQFDDGWKIIAGSVLMLG